MHVQLILLKVVVNCQREPFIHLFTKIIKTLSQFKSKLNLFQFAANCSESRIIIGQKEDIFEKLGWGNEI